MKKVFLLLSVMVLLSASSFAAINEYDITQGGTLTINATGTKSSPVFKVREGRIRSIAYQFSSTVGTPDVKVSYTVCRTSDGTFHAPDSVDALNSSVADEVEHTVAFSPVVNKYYKILFTGNASNPADTVVDVLKLLDAIQN